jgi:polyhydroxybutyrate depolymerase
MKRFHLVAVPFVLVAAQSCASEPETGVPGDDAGSTSAGTGNANSGGSAGAAAGKGGASGSGTGAGTGGTSTSGGKGGSGATSGAGGTTGGSTSAGSGGKAGSGGNAAGNGGSVSVGGKAGSTSTGGNGGNASGNGGSSSGSGGAAGGSGGSGGGKAPVVPSAGCGKGGRPSGGTVTVAGNHIYTFPASYDGTTPMGLIFGFHANGNPIDQIKTLTQDSELPNHFVMAFPKSAGAGWVENTDRQHIQDNYDELLDDYYIDTNRIFATGHSSGAQLIVQFMCRDDKRWKAIAPVASSVYCASWDPIPTLLIHGKNDSERGSTSQDADGKKDLAPYLTSNGCGMTTTPKTVPGCTSSGTQVVPGCVDYEGCDQPMTWCNHNDPFYSGTNHGWPCFAADLMDEFFSSF